MMWHHSWGAGDWVAMSLMMLVFWGALVAGAVWLVRNARRPLENSNAAARQILDEKLARGEVTEEEYLRRRELLTR